MPDKYFKYCNDIFNYSRLKTSVVNIGNIPLGGNNPIRIQSMTNTPTLDTKACVNQIIKIADAGADYVRLTTQNIKEAENLASIKKELTKQNYAIPLIADIHFNPLIAEVAAKLVEKIRINPGNFSNNTTKFEFTNHEYQLEIEKAHDKFLPLLNICKENGTAIRIGSNHGSLSNRIMSKYGDTPLGMVESSMEFLRMCQQENFHNVVVSMKSSNTRVMVYANRLLVNKMLKEDINFPLHLGVTEAGEGEDGRIKSAVGIGSLIADGIGDTIRISLTEDPDKEIPTAKKLVNYYSRRKETKTISLQTEFNINPFEYNKRETIQLKNIGGNNPCIVISPDVSPLKQGLLNPEFIFNKTNNQQYLTDKTSEKSYEILTPEEYIACSNEKSEIQFIKVHFSEFTNQFLSKLKSDSKVTLILFAKSTNWTQEIRASFFILAKYEIKNPVTIHQTYDENDLENLQLISASDIGSLLIDGFGDGIWIDNNGNINEKELNSLQFGILQASRVRISRTEYISCPGCGRTLFNLQEITAKIRERTSHLTGLKIGIMGCIVNGPGEMADADYGYVGSGKNYVNLYKGRQIVKSNISPEYAVDQLINLIKENGDWVDP